MTITKCLECPFLNTNDTCNHPDADMWLANTLIIHRHCPIAQGKPFIISFTPINNEDEKVTKNQDPEIKNNNNGTNTSQTQRGFCNYI